jgi:hypothetical protein
MAKKHTNEMRAAKVAQKFGWKYDDREAQKAALQPVAFRVVDSGNVARIATALERIGGYLSRIAAAQEQAAKQHEATR